MKTIVLIDDELALVEALAGLLQGEGYRVVSAANGKDGLARIREEKPDLVVTDLMMPIADGRQVVRGMQAVPELRAIPVAMISASPREVALEDGGSTLPVAGYLHKPFRWEKLLALVVGLIGRGEQAPGQGFS